MPSIEHVFDTLEVILTGINQEHPWRASTEGTRPSARPTASTTSPATISFLPVAPTTRRGQGAGAGRGSLGVLMPSSQTLKTPLSGTNHSDIGMLVHALIATHAPLGSNGVYPADLVDRLNAVARGLLDASNTARRIAIASQSVGLAHRYLTTLAPAALWTLLGVEFNTGDGPVDVAWIDPHGRVMFDEVKTSYVATRAMPQRWIAQVRRYAAAGTATYGEQFAGARLLPINAPHLGRLVPVEGMSLPLAPTPTEPFRTQAGER